jgi:hypothetical protein
LNRADFPKVKFWTDRAFNDAMKDGIGDTNGLATEKRKAGRPRKSSDVDEESPTSYPYLETTDGDRVSSDMLTAMNKKLKRLFESLVLAKIAPKNWGNVSEAAHEFVMVDPD